MEAEIEVLQEDIGDRLRRIYDEEAEAVAARFSSGRTRTQTCLPEAVAAQKVAEVSWLVLGKGGRVCVCSYTAPVDEGATTGATERRDCRGSGLGKRE